MTDEDAVQQEAPADGADEAADADAVAGEGTETGEDLVARVAAHDEALAGDVEALRDRAADLEATVEDREAELEELTERLQRTQADFQNYKKRAEQRREDLKERATEDLVERLLDVRDNLARALEQDDADADDLRDGVSATLRSLDDVLEDEGVVQVDPEPGDDVDPHRHEVLMRVESDRPEGTVDEVYRPGYEMADAVLRTAQVTVSEGPDGGAAE